MSETASPYCKMQAWEKSENREHIRVIMEDYKKRINPKINIKQAVAEEIEVLQHIIQYHKNWLKDVTKK